MSKTQLFHGALAALCIALVVSGGCGTKQEIIKIGAILPLSGAAALGTQHLHGLTLAIEELNASNPLVVYELIVEDEGSDSQRAVEAFNKLLTVDKVMALVTATDAASLAVAPKTEQNFVPLFVNCAHPLIVTMFRDVFRNFPSTALEIRTTVAFASQFLKAKTIALLHSDDSYGKGAAESVRNEAADGGIQLAGLEPFDPSLADQTGSVNAILAQKPEVVLVYGPGRGSLDVIVALRASGFTGAICACRSIAQVSSSQLAARVLEGCYFAATAFELSGNDDFALRFRTRFKAEPTLNVVAEYDAMMILAKAVDIKRAERISLTNALKKLGDVSGVLGPYRYADREWSPQISIVQHRGPRTH